MHNINNVNNVLVKHIQLAAVNPKDAAILFASIYNNYLKTSGSYVFMNDLKNFLSKSFTRNLATTVQVLVFLQLLSGSRPPVG